MLSAEPQTTTRPAVFIVEDERLVALDLAEELQSMGYEVAGVAATGEQALADIGRAKPDLVLLDVMLEGKLDGINTATELRANIDTPFIFLTAYTDDATIGRAKLTGPSGFIVKPYNRRELNAAIQVALHGTKERARLRRLLACFSAIEETVSSTSRALSDAPAPATSEAPLKSVPIAKHDASELAGSNRLRQYQLSVREEEVLRYFLAGYQATTIGKWLHISPQTIRNHLKRICRRLGVNSQAELRELFAPPIESGSN